ncbi:MAG: acyl-CoA dehydrogenase family protein [Phycisphaerae bacterium]|jgi:alkylation response protein AidB-like acyl-CoA dehydrogenase
MASKLSDLTGQLAELAEHYDTHSCWPQRSMDILGESGCWRWAIPKRWGGLGLGDVGLLEAYEAVAHGCLATALILTQRDGACDLIARGANDGLRKRLLRAYARAERFTSIGIAQLSTSQHGRKPALIAKRVGRDYILDGVMPWVTAAEHCDEIVTGAVLADGRRIIACVSCEDPGVTCEPPMQLMALGASCTSRVRCRAVRVRPVDLVTGPGEQTPTMRAPVKPLVVSAVGIGLAGALADRLGRCRASAELKSHVRTLLRAYRRVRGRLYAAAESVGQRNADVGVSSIRVSVNDLVTRLGMAHLLLSKGTGYAQPHAAERLLREAMFFLVWSAPAEVQDETLRMLVSGLG